MASDGNGFGAAHGMGPVDEMDMMAFEQANTGRRLQTAGSAPSPPPEWGAATTVMMRNVPNKYTQGMVLMEFNETGFLGTYDFFYLPIDPRTNANRGYAFINFIDSDAAWKFKTVYEGRKMRHFNSTKHVSVTPATLQGFDANYAHYSSARVSRGDPAARPLFLRTPSSNTGGRGGGRNRRHRGQLSAMDQANMMLDSHHASPAMQLQQTAQATMAGIGSGQSVAAINALAAAQSAAAVANVIAQKQAIPPNSSTAPRSTGTNEQRMVGGPGPRFCPFCGQALASGVRFCPSCGENVEGYSSARVEGYPPSMQALDEWRQAAAMFPCDDF